jgi:Trk-type K+ transport system membrane component
MFYILEKDNTLKGLSPYGQFVTSFFSSVTPRTAGFNTIDITTMLNSTIMIYLLLMWIGASPGSTGGGIKTTTFALATFNLYNQIRGEEKLILMHKTIPGLILNRIMSIISLSLIAIGLGTTLIIISQPELDPYDVIFECFSAFGTVGLSLGITVKLNTFSKIVIILLMFLGRVSFLNFLLAFFSTFLKRKKNNTIIYPETKIFVN